MDSKKESRREKNYIIHIKKVSSPYKVQTNVKQVRKVWNITGKNYACIWDERIMRGRKCEIVGWSQIKSDGFPYKKAVLFKTILTRVNINVMNRECLFS